MLFAAPDATICGPAIGTPGHGLRPDEGLDLLRQPVLRQRHGRRARRQRRAQRDGLLVGHLPGEHRQLLVSRTSRRPGRADHDLAGVAAGLQRRQGPELEHGHRRRPATRASSRLPGRLRGVGLPERQPDGLLLDQDAAAAGGSRARSSSSTALATFCALVGANPTCAPFARQLTAGGTSLAASVPTADGDASAWMLPASITARPLGLYTCASWKMAGPAVRRGVLARLHNWVGGSRGLQRPHGLRRRAAGRLGDVAVPRTLQPAPVRHDRALRILWAGGGLRGGGA